VAGIVGIHTRARPLTLLSLVRFSSLTQGCYSSAIPVLSGTTTAVGAYRPATLGYGGPDNRRRPLVGPDVAAGASFFEVDPPGPGAGRPCAPCREWRIF
jgi:hypothetical protein